MTYFCLRILLPVDRNKQPDYIAIMMGLDALKISAYLTKKGLLPDNNFKWPYHLTSHLPKNSSTLFVLLFEKSGGNSTEKLR